MFALAKSTRVVPQTEDWSSREVRPRDLVRHFKGNLYMVDYIATHTETGERMVVYEPVVSVDNFKHPAVVRLNNDKVYARPYDMFVSKVDRDKYPEVQQEYRFELVEIGSEG